MPEIPPMGTMLEKYPHGNPADVAVVVGGVVQKNLQDQNYKDYKDTCAIRVSHALNLAGDPIPASAAKIANPFRPGSKVRLDKGDSGFYIYSTLDMRAYLNTRYGQAKVFKPKKGVDREAEIKGLSLKGIIAFGWIHIDLWDGAGCARSCYFKDPRVKDKEILLWVTK
jgi:hypothetical protein